MSPNGRQIPTTCSKHPKTLTEIKTICSSDKKTNYGVILCSKHPKILTGIETPDNRVVCAHLIGEEAQITPKPLQGLKQLSAMIFLNQPQIQAPQNPYRDCNSAPFVGKIRVELAPSTPRPLQ